MAIATTTDRANALELARQAKKAREEGRLDDFVKEARSPQAAAQPASTASAAAGDAALDEQQAQQRRDSAAAPPSPTRPSASPFGRFLRRNGMEEPNSEMVDPDDLEDHAASRSAWASDATDERATRATGLTNASAAVSTAPSEKASDPAKGSAPAAAARPTNPYADLARKSAQRRAVGHALRNRPAQADPQWDDDTIPAGSNYTAQEWADARTPDVWVFEVRNAGQSCLMAVDKPPRPRQSRSVASGKVVPVLEPVPDHLLDATLPAELGSLWDGCMLLAPSATTSHPGAVSGWITMRTGHEVFGDMLYRLVRPESHRSTVPWYFGVKGSFEFPGALSSALAATAGEAEEAAAQARQSEQGGLEAQLSGESAIAPDRPRA